MYVRRFVSAAAAALSVAVCVYITYISRDVELGSLILNLAFLGVMVIALCAALFSGMLRLAGISRGLARAAEKIRTLPPKEGAYPEEGLFENTFLDGCYSQYLSMAKQHPDGSCDIADFVNEDVIETTIHRGLLELVPDVLTSLGILGTFIGLVLGLRSFDPSGYEQMAGSVSPLIDGIKVAFVTSIYGLSLSLPFSFNLRSELSELSANLDAFLDVFYLHVSPSHEIGSASRLLEQKKSQEELTNDLTGLFVEQMSKSFEQSITPAFSHMTDSINRIVESFTQTQEEAVAQICQAVIRDMRSELTSDFTQIGETVAQLEKTQTSYMNFMDRSLQRLQMTFHSLQDQMEKTDSYNARTLKQLAQAQQEAVKINEEQKSTYQEYIRFMYHSIEQFSEVWERNSEKLQAYSDEIGRMGPVQSTREIRKDISDLSAKLSELQQMQHHTQAQLSEPDESEELFREISQKLSSIERLAAEPTLLRRKKRGDMTCEGSERNLMSATMYGGPIPT